MLRKRTRSHQRDPQKGHLTMSDSGPEPPLQSDIAGHSQRSNSFFAVPGLFVGLNPKGLPDADAVRSPTSPLDFKVFSSLGNNFRSPRSTQCGHQRSWDCYKVGLSIVDSLDDDLKSSGKVLRSSDSKNILFGPQMRIKSPQFESHVNSFEAPRSLPKNYAFFPQSQTKSPLRQGDSSVVFEIGGSPAEPESLGKIRSCSLDSCRSFLAVPALANSSNAISENAASKVSSAKLLEGSPKLSTYAPTRLNPVSSTLGSGNSFTESLSATDIELSEDYTCVISHGPVPKTTHIFGDYILEQHSNSSTNSAKSERESESPITATKPVSPYPSDGFLSFCYSCRKKLEEGKDIYIYGGDKAFCSLNCRSEEILFDEEMEKVDESTGTPKVDSDAKLF